MTAAADVFLNIITTSPVMKLGRSSITKTRHFVVRGSTNISIITVICII